MNAQVELTERYCVVLQTLCNSPSLSCLSSARPECRAPLCRQELGRKISKN